MYSVSPCGPIATSSTHASPLRFFAVADGFRGSTLPVRTSTAARFVRAMPFTFEKLPPR